MFFFLSFILSGFRTSFSGLFALFNAYTLAHLDHGSSDAVRYHRAIFQTLNNLSGHIKVFVSATAAVSATVVVFAAGIVAVVAVGSKRTGIFQPVFIGNDDELGEGFRWRRPWGLKFSTGHAVAASVVVLADTAAAAAAVVVVVVAADFPVAFSYSDGHLLT